MTITIAIAGGGIAGLCLARGLSKYPNLTITVYEGVKHYLDIGGGLAFHGNAIRALELIDPELQAEYFRRATLMNEQEIEMATQVVVADSVVEDGKPALLAELGKAKGRKTVARSDLLEGLLSLVPEGIVKFGKRLDHIQESATGEKTPISLTFKDGCTATADVLIGCDGVHMLPYLLGADHPAVGLKNHDNWEWFQRPVPAEEVNALNPNLFTYVGIFCGHESYMNAIPTKFGTVLSVQGTFRQYGVFIDEQLIKAPANLTSEQIAAIPVAAGTAMNALLGGPAKVQKGMTVLTQGTGGVSCFAIQIAVAAGATVISTSSSDTKLEYTKQLGATHTINYLSTPDWETEVLKLTDGKGIDIVVEIGGSGTIEKSLASVKSGGQVSVVGILSKSTPADLIPSILYGGKTLWGVFGVPKKVMVEMAELFEEQNIRPLVGKVFEFENAVKAFEMSKDNQVVGKIVIKV